MIEVQHRKIVNISQIADQSSQNARETSEANQMLVDVTQNFGGMARQFSP